MSNFPILDVIDNRFYFGIGGMGDFLLLMSTFYDKEMKKLRDSPTGYVGPDVVFVCNNIHVIKEMAKEFPLIDRLWFYPRKSFLADQLMWENIITDEHCWGTGVTPKDFNYIKDWIECGKSDVFEYYGVKEHPEFAKPIKPRHFIVIQPFGGADDTTKKKEIPQQDIHKITEQAYEDGLRVIFIGSEKDKDNLPLNKLALESGQAHWVTDIRRAMPAIRGCCAFYGADSWGKTLACMAGKKTAVYKSKYSFPPEEQFGHYKDPGNHVFLDGWDIIMEEPHVERY